MDMTVHRTIQKSLKMNISEFNGFARKENASFVNLQSTSQGIVPVEGTTGFPHN
jgi:type II secretory ATPase GspE/PulE/Tfp pilus assembly ATPase PilB-like protein